MNDVPAAADDLLRLYRIITIAHVRDERPDLTLRQMAVFLNVYGESTAWTVRGLAADLKVSKPAITRALDRLQEFDLVARQTDPQDRRSVLVRRTSEGTRYLSWVRTRLGQASRGR